MVKNLSCVSCAAFFPHKFTTLRHHLFYLICASHSYKLGYARMRKMILLEQMQVRMYNGSKPFMNSHPLYYCYFINTNSIMIFRAIFFLSQRKK